MDYSNVINIVVAAGSGSRFGGDMPKQFCLLEGIPVLVHAVSRLKQALPKSKCITVVSTGYLQYTRDLLHQYGHDDVAITTGGDTRWQSVKNALDVADNVGKCATVITVHDGARPLVTATTARAVIEACTHASGAIPTIPVTDSLRQITRTGESVAVNRSEFRAVQTPQAFQAKLLRQAYNQPYRTSFTDDASVMTAAGFGDIIMVDGDPRNIKITHHCDIDIASIYLKSMQ